MSFAISECRAATTRVLFDFRDAQQRGSWVNVNDSVMGGVSQGRDRFTERGETRIYWSTFPGE